jgi:hypothetical protein
MNVVGLKLFVPEKSDVERDMVASAWIAAGGEVIRLGRFWEPPSIEPRTVRVYGNDTFCLVLQQKLGLELISPPDELIFTVPKKFLRRSVAQKKLGELTESAFPAFFKPVTPKLFKARIYENIGELSAECKGLSDQTAVIASAPVTFTAEARCFVLNRAVLDCSIYDGEADGPTAAAAVKELVGEIDAPSALVVDVGFIKDQGWALVEFNAAWGAGLNGCRADRVLPCIAAASTPC